MAHATFYGLPIKRESNYLFLSSLSLPSSSDNDTLIAVCADQVVVVAALAAAVIWQWTEK